MKPLKPRFAFWLALFLSGALIGCSTLDTTKGDPKVLLQEAKDYLKVNNYEDAKTILEDLLEDFPDSKEREVAQILLGETLYRDGQYEEAQVHYKRFLELYPASRLAPRAQYFKTMSDFRLMDAVTRDQTFSQYALDGFDLLIKQYPNSKYSRLAQKRRKKCLTNLAMNQMEIGRFYFRTSAFQAAISRLKKLVATYPQQTFLDEAIFLLGESYYNEQSFKNAKSYYRQLIQEFPRSEFVKEARTRLRTIRRNLF